MERLTYRDNYGARPVPPFTRANLVDRLAAIEDILGDEYEVDDLVQVVRCKECKFWKRDNEKVGHCYLLDETKPTEYCSDEQREKGAKGTIG